MHNTYFEYTHQYLLTYNNINNMNNNIKEEVQEISLDAYDTIIKQERRSWEARD